MASNEGLQKMLLEFFRLSELLWGKVECKACLAAI